MQSLSPQEQRLNYALLNLPRAHDYRYGQAASYELRRTLFCSLARSSDDYLHYFFPHGTPSDRSEVWSLKKAQGAVDGAEYSAAAKGTACGHIFRSGESTYHCKTCAADDTCVLCARCFDASDHDGHQVFVSVSPGNSGCCDCGDREAWRREVICTIHTSDAATQSHDSGKEKQPAGRVGEGLPDELVEAIRLTIARVIDYLCDVLSCSPEQMRLPKSEEGIMKDEEDSRLSGVYGEEHVPDAVEYALILWNDEKHTVHDVQNQVARACRDTKTFGFAKAMEVDGVGRSIVRYSKNPKELLKMAETLEHIKVTVTIRSARDTFREQMCEEIIDWISDIAGCSVGSNAHVLRNVVCEELLKPWRKGSQASNMEIGQDGIDDHETEDNEKLRRRWLNFMRPFQTGIVEGAIIVENVNDDNDGAADENDNEDEIEEDDEMMDMEDDEMEIEVEDIRAAANAAMAAADAGDADMNLDYLDDNEDVTEALEATLAGYPPPPPPPTSGARRRIFTPTESDDGEPEPPRPAPDEPFGKIPRTPKVKGHIKKLQKPSRHWLQKPDGFLAPRPTEPCEDLWQRVRLDYLILYDLRLWKTLRIHLRHLYITTVVTIPHFKRILGLRFAGLYTALAQLYLVADREPDHSIINLSVQMLTTPSITQEVVERGNFLSNLMAILYTFLTTRQVGFPEDVSPNATLAFDAGAVTNRRMFHFFLDLRWLFQSDFILQRIQVEQRYLLQFLDLVKLHQGVCPNVRAFGEHVEYESDAWISASMIVKEVNKLCKQVGVAFEPKSNMLDDSMHLQRAIRTVAQTTLINSSGRDRKRFTAAEVKDELKWHVTGPFEPSGKRYSVPSGVVQSEPISFHHPLHYLLSWLIEDAKNLDREELRSLLQFSPDDLKDPWNATRSQSLPSNLGSDDLLAAIFDHPLRVCVWLAQMKAGMWVRNGITLRHQAHTYRGVSHRDVGYQRDIFMIQAGFVLSGADHEKPGERFLAQMIDRFQMEEWVKGNYSLLPGFDDLQQMDVFEDFYHLLVVALSERGNLVPATDGQEQHDNVLEHDIAHALCFKPLSFSDLANRVTEKVSESDDFSRVLESMTNYRAPEGLNDTGTFELKPDFIGLVDPYYAHYSRNHREEAESTYKKHVAAKQGKRAEDVVYEPNLQPIPSGLFAELSAFTATPLFVQVIASGLGFAQHAKNTKSKLQTTRIETFLHMVLHLVLVATMEDSGQEEHGFIQLAARPTPQEYMHPQSGFQSIVYLLRMLSSMEEYATCHPAIKNILRKMQMQLPEIMGHWHGHLGHLLDRTETSSPASISSEDKERKKQEALARQARVMAQMKQQQNSFLQNQGLSGFEEDFEDFDDMSITEEPENVEHRKTWNFPTGTCIWCQEETDDQRLYGTFAFLGESKILRTTPVDNPAFVREVIDTPASLDRSADELRPFGVAGNNKSIVQKRTPSGKVIEYERQGLSEGFPCDDQSFNGPVATSCGHIMHYSCFELYIQNSYRRHQQQIARNQPESYQLNEFTCPLCKALGNTFLPIIWKAKDCAHENELHVAKSFDQWLSSLDSTYLEPVGKKAQQTQEFMTHSQRYVDHMLAPSLAASMGDLSLDSPASAQTSPQRYSLRRGSSLSRFLPWGRSEGSQSSIDTTNLSPTTSTESRSRMTELMKAYGRLDETVSRNSLLVQKPQSFVNPVPSLSCSLGLSISAFEIAHRGVGNNSLSTSLLSDLQEQALTHFRILSETIDSYLAIHFLRPNTSNLISAPTTHQCERMTSALFGSDNSPLPSEVTTEMPFQIRLFEGDTFLFFVHWLMYMRPTVADATNVLQLCLWAETVKTALVYAPLLQFTDTLQRSKGSQRPAGTEFEVAMHAALRHVAGNSSNASLTSEQYPLLRHIIERYMTAFLRKCILIVFVRYGLDFECPYNIDPEVCELERLTKLLHISSLDELCAVHNSQSPAGNKGRRLTHRWLTEAANCSIKLPHPAIFELVGLPKTYDALTEEAIKRRCPKTGKDITDPAVCLFCGAIFCSQAVCCMAEKSKGGCTQHMAHCGGKVGVFINIRKCMVLFMHGPGNGSWAHAPYLDKHGEPDPTLRRHHQLFLHRGRYDKLVREVWLQHLIPTVISRKLEADVNPGGWETL